VFLVGLLQFGRHIQVDGRHTTSTISAYVSNSQTANHTPLDHSDLPTHVPPRTCGATLRAVRQVSSGAQQAGSDCPSHAMKLPCAHSRWRGFHHRRYPRRRLSKSSRSLPDNVRDIWQHVPLVSPLEKFAGGRAAKHHGC
jgi:hypothetical protein